MQVILNDFSLSGQFKDEQDFADEVNKNLLPILKKINESECCILKGYDSYKNYVTPSLTLLDILKMVNDADITVLKSYLVSLSSEEPYWNDEIKTDINAIYDCGNSNLNKVIPNCITEALERDKLIMSFSHNGFVDKSINVHKNGDNLVVDNIFNINTFLENLFSRKAVNIIEFFQDYEIGIKPKFLMKDEKCYLEELFENGNLVEKDMHLIKDDIIEMLDTIPKGVRTRFSQPLGESLYEFRTSISDNREFRIFYVYSKSSKNTTVFLNGCIKKSQKTHKSELELARKLAKECC